MDISQIPRSFWHALSFCMVSATLGLLYIAHASSSVSIEIANAKIELSSAISQAKDIKNKLADENKRLVLANTLLKEKIQSLEEQATQSSKGISLEDLKSHGIGGNGISDISRLITDPIDSTWVKELETKIDSAEQALRK